MTWAQTTTTIKIKPCMVTNFSYQCGTPGKKESQFRNYLHKADGFFYVCGTFYRSLADVRGPSQFLAKLFLVR